MELVRTGFADVVLPLPLSDPYTYSVPEALLGKLRIGHRVEVQMGKRWMVGVVVGEKAKPPEAAIRPIATILDSNPVLLAEQFELLRWISGYYRAPLGEVVRMALPPGLMDGERWSISLAPVGRALLAGLPHPELSRLDPATRKKRLSRLMYLPQTGEISLKSFVRKAGKIGRPSLRLWEEEGLIRLSSQPPGRGVAARMLDQLQASTDRDEGLAMLTRSPKQALAFETLCDIGAVLRRDFVAEDSSRASAVRQLVARGLVSVSKVELRRGSISGHRLDNAAAQPPVLRKDQRRAVEALKERIDAGGHETFLLYGPPGSGKTEVYLHAAAEALSAGKNALLLVPEISLTPQLASRVVARFGDEVAILHSALSDGERHDEWKRIRDGGARLVVGARLAVLSPLPDIGLIVVDEEQDGSYKSEERVFYNARDTAVMRAKQCGASVILGSATPSVESVANAREGRYKELLLERPDNRPGPEIKLIDLSRVRSSGRSGLGSELILAIDDRLKRGEQSILFLNRRGYAPYLHCRNCGAITECPHCSLPLAYHRTVGKMLCHACGYGTDLPPFCSDCGRPELELSGMGTQRVEDGIQRSFPDASIARLDRDATSRKGRMTDILRSFAAGEIDILIGTQMVSKGHDFPNVTLVGVLSADNSLGQPDFRAAERSFQLLTQVAGRAGRADAPGEVFIQTFRPEHHVLQCVADHDPRRFYDLELKQRRGLYPPFTRLAILRIEGEKERAAKSFTAALAEKLRKIAGSDESLAGIAVLGPATAPIFVVRGRFRYRILIRAKNHAQRQRLLDRAESLGMFASAASIKLAIDIDPAQTL